MSDYVAGMDCAAGDVAVVVLERDHPGDRWRIVHTDPAEFKPLGHVTGPQTLHYPHDDVDVPRAEDWMRTFTAKTGSFRLSPQQAEDLAAWYENNPYPMIKSFLQV